jgi:transketolase
MAAVETAIRAAQQETARPSLVICRTIIGYGSPEEGTGKVHGEPLGAEHTQAAKKRLGWPLEPAFLVPDDVRAHMSRHVELGARAEAAWNARMDAYAAAFPDKAAEFGARMRGDLPEGWDTGLDDLFAGSKPIATRVAGGKVMNALAPRLPALMGGSADLAPSTKTLIDGGGDFSPEDHGGRNMHFGIREHAMGAIANGMTRHGGFIPYTATFLTFADYMRPAIRLAALMGIRVVFIFTHDSIGLGEDGPTHQPVEHLAVLRAIPHLNVIRPADATETTEAWLAAIRYTYGPTVLALSRQNLPVLDRARYGPADGVQRGGYVLWESSANPELIFIATGSEVAVTLQAAQALVDDGVAVRVVSLPCWELFDAQPIEYRQAVLPVGVRARVAVEAGIPMGWERYTGSDGAMVCVQHFGASAPGEVVMTHFGFTPEHIADVARETLQRVRQ